MSSPRIKPTHLAYKNPHTPFSPIFEDIYFDSTEGIQESNYVYLEGVGLKEKIQSGQKNLTVGEIGFGVALNFLLTLKTFLDHAGPDQHLTYISAEKHPVFKKDLEILYSTLPDLKPYAEMLLKLYPLFTPGYHWIRFPHHPVSLLLMFGDATEMFSQLEAKVDFWYWDGFSPSKNPEAFSEPLFQELARVSSPHAVGATFSAAGWVRRGLESAGFKIEKRLGFGRKRECMVGRFQNQNSPSKLLPWFSNQNLVRAVPGKDKIGVIGAGLAGTAIAQSLYRRGFEVHIIDQYGIAERASSNDVGLYDVQLSKLPNPMSRFSQLSLSHFLRELTESGLPHKKGILRINDEAVECLKNGEYPDDFYEVLNAEQASNRAEVDISKEAIYFPECGIVSPRALCMRRIQGNKIHVHKTVHTVKRNDSAEKNFFTLLDEDGSVIADVDHLIYATGADTPFSLNELSDYPLKPVRGQTIQVQPTDESRMLQVTLFDQGYISPIAPQVSENANHLIGTTYQAKTVHPDQLARDTETLLREARNKWSCFRSLKRSDVVSEKEGYRLSTPDKLPLIGPKTDSTWLKVNYQKSIKGQQKRTDAPLAPLEVQPREWMLLGLSSRGIIFSSYGAEILASLMCGEVLPVERDLWEHLHSARFFVRNLKKPNAESILG